MGSLPAVETGHRPFLGVGDQPSRSCADDFAQRPFLAPCRGRRGIFPLTPPNCRLASFATATTGVDVPGRSLKFFPSRPRAEESSSGPFPPSRPAIALSSASGVDHRGLAPRIEPRPSFSPFLSRYTATRGSLPALETGYRPFLVSRRQSPRSRAEDRAMTLLFPLSPAR